VTGPQLQSLVPESRTNANVPPATRIKRVPLLCHAFALFHAFFRAALVKRTILIQLKNLLTVSNLNIIVSASVDLTDS
jgi:hypothetical protein